jgi:hypothetical protein
MSRIKSSGKAGALHIGAVAQRSPGNSDSLDTRVLRKASYMPKRGSKSARQIGSGTVPRCISDEDGGDDFECAFIQSAREPDRWKGVLDFLISVGGSEEKREN